MQRERSRAAGDELTARVPEPEREPRPGAPSAFDAHRSTRRSPIKHVVFLIKENRTFDNLFGTFPGANGVRVGNDNGQPRPLVRGTDGRTTSDIPHCYPCAISAWDGGRMDNFDQGVGGDWAYTSSIRTSSRTTGMGGRIPLSTTSRGRPGSSYNHLYWIAATSGGAHDNPRRTGLLLEHVRVDAPPQQLVEVVASEGR